MINNLIRRKWLWVLIGGILLFIITEQAYLLTENAFFFPTVLLIGSFIVPLTFVTYIYEREQKLDIHPDSPIVSAVTCFFAGGAIGTVVAGVLEYAVLGTLDVVSLVGVGLIEEAAKLILPVAIFLRGRFRSEMDGILFGVTSGMGFASLETMGYGLVAYVQASGDIGTLEQVLLLRGIFSPVGHAAWTGLICAVLWRERILGRHRSFNIRIIGAYILAVVLHFLWDFSSSLAGTSPGSIAAAILGSLAVAAVSLIVLIIRLRESRRFAADSHT